MEQTDLLRYALETLEQLDLPYAIVGSFGSSTYGEPRLTHDIDIVVELRNRDIPGFCRRFPPPDFYLSEAAVREAVRQLSQFNVINLESRAGTGQAVWPVTAASPMAQGQGRSREYLPAYLRDELAEPRITVG